MDKALKFIENFLIYALVFAIPLVVFPIFPNAFISSKAVILTWGLALIILCKTFKVLFHGQVKGGFGNFDIPVLFIALSYIGATIVKTPNKMEALVLPGTTTIIVSAILLYFLINQMKDEAKRNIQIPLLVSGVFVSIISLMAISGIFKGFTSLPEFMRAANFTSLESTLSALIFLTTLLPFAISRIVTEEDSAIKVLYGGTTGIIIIGLLIALVQSLPGRTTVVNLPSFQTGWTVAVDTLKESPLLGGGPGNYLTSFNKFRPISYNQSDLWAVRFSTARSFYMTVATEVGLLGLTGFVLLFLKIFAQAKAARKTWKEDGLMSFKTSSLFSLLVLMAFLLIFPASVTLIVLLFILLALSSKVHRTQLGMLSAHTAAENEQAPDWANKLPLIISVSPLFLAALGFMFFSSKAIAAELSYKQSLDALARNDGKVAYDKLREAVNQNPYVDRYRSTYAQVNLTLANAIAKKETVTEEDKKTISQLLQQAIREGKATVTLNQTRSSNWEVLSTIYKSIISLAKGADQFAIQTMQQAVLLDPINPNLRINLGGILYSLKIYDEAIEAYRLAVATKPDLANARYNLALAYKEIGNTDKAIAELTRVLELVKKDSKDYEIAKAELDNLENKKASTPTTAGETLGAPTTPSNSVIDPKLDLPSDANPPAAVSSPAPSPTPAASPTASPSPTPDTP